LSSSYDKGDDDAHVARLVDVKRRLDPDNVFHLNQNVDPS
jgi:FAD/FMN-containing dehydrogenase